MSIISQMNDLTCPADNITLTADSCLDDFGVIQGIVWQKQDGITPFADFTTGAGGMALEATWTTAKALADSDNDSLRTLALECITSVMTGGDANTVDYPDSTSGLEQLVSYNADQWELNILQPSSTLIAGLRDLSALQAREGLNMWFISDKNNVMGGLAGFKVTALIAPSATRGQRTTNDQSMLTIKFRRIPVAADITSIDPIDLDLAIVL